jgi:hypothetical protein
VTTGAGAYPAELAVGVTRDRIRELSPAARSLHKAILRAFATAGRAPHPAALLPGHSPGALPRELHERDVIRLNDDGRIRSAYPFSGTPTAHVVAIDGGPTLYAMCAIDALGIGHMLGRNTVITSTDPVSRQTVQVNVQDGHAAWKPTTAVVFAGAETTPATCRPPTAAGTCVVAAADRCCGVTNFLTGPDTAQAWVAAHPDVSGVVLSQTQALRLGVDIFGRLLDD